MLNIYEKNILRNYQMSIPSIIKYIKKVDMNSKKAPGFSNERLHNTIQIMAIKQAKA